MAYPNVKRSAPYALPAESGLHTHRKPELSLVIPVLNEQEVLEHTYQKLKEQMQSLGLTYEIIFVNDGSSDRSLAILTAISAADTSVTVISLARNFGHELATTAGLRYARGLAAVIIDADLQDPPELIETFIQKWREGYEVVYGVRKSRAGESWLKRLTAFLFYRLMARISDVKIPADTGDFRLIDRRVIEVFRTLPENPRFFRGMISWIGFKQIGVPFHRQPRLLGHSKYRYFKLIQLAFDTVTSFSGFPATAIFYCSLGTALLSAFLIAATIFLGLIGSFSLQPFHWIIVATNCILNLQFIAIALLAQYIIRTHRNTQRRPLYTLDRIIRNGKATHKSQRPI